MGMQKAVWIAVLLLGSSAALAAGNGGGGNAGGASDAAVSAASGSSMSPGSKTHATKKHTHASASKPASDMGNMPDAASDTKGGK
jgi:hypothetical protein